MLSVSLIRRRQLNERGTVKETILTMADKIVEDAKETTQEFCDLYGESPVLKEIFDLIENASKEKLITFK